jgi:hypothetical protein
LSRDKQKKYFAPIPVKYSKLDCNKKIGAKAPFFLLFKEMSSEFTKPVKLNLLYKKYMEKYSSSLEEAKKVFYLEQGNYNLTKPKKEIIVNSCFSLNKKDYARYMVLNPNYYEKYCCGKTKIGMKCRQYRTLENFCQQHHPTWMKGETVPTTNVYDKVLETKDIEKLRNICVVVYEQYNGLWSDIITFAKKRETNKEIMLRIDKLEQELKKLKEEVE